MVGPEIVTATTWHGRRGTVDHTFHYRVDYVLLDPEAPASTALLARNRWSVASVHDRDHGGPRGTGADWARQALDAHGLDAGYCLLLLTQPRWFGTVFNPVSFWLALRGDALVAVIAEVNNTYGDRHSYLCARPGFAPIEPGTMLTAAKVFHVSPFRDIAGHYAFSFDVSPQAIAIRIVHRAGTEELVATLAGPRRPLTAARVMRAAVRFPGAGFRATALIRWQALRLWLKRAKFRPRPRPPAEDITY